MAFIGGWEMQDDAANTNVLDSSGNGHTGTYTQNTSVGTTTGPGNDFTKALSFNSTSKDNVDVPFDITFYGQAILSIWAAFKVNPDTNTNAAMMGTWTGGQTSYRLYAHTGINQLYFSTGTTVGGNLATNHGVNIADGLWHTIIGMWSNPNTADLYLDGTLVANNSTPLGLINAGTNNLTLGADAPTGSANFWSGELCNVGVANHLLSTSERASIDSHFSLFGEKAVETLIAPAITRSVTAVVDKTLYPIVGDPP